MAAVGVGTGAMSSLLGKLTTLLSDEYNLLKRVRKEIEFLKRELGRMHALLETLADMEKLDPMAKEWRDNVRDLSYDVEGCIDRFMDSLGSGDAKPGFMKKTARWLKTLWMPHDIATQIKDLKARVVEESERRDRYRLEDYHPAKSVESERRDRYKLEDYRGAKTVEIDPQLAALHEEVKGLVALAGPMKHVISWLKDDKVVQLKVMAIVGSGGLGKTTLALEVYRNIGVDFQCRASVSVSRVLDLENLLKGVLSQIDEDEYEKCQRDRWEKEQLIRGISQILTGKRYLIVIDDVWRERDWKLVKAAFPENNSGSRIIATTRSTSVANSCCSNPSDQLYQMAPLDEVESRKLFLKRTFRSDNSCPAELDGPCTRILKKCGGMPLAIITIASLLANKSHDKDEWERLQESIGVGSSLQSDGHLKGIEDILLLSYWDLPHQLKTCLLYLCIYPEDHRIPCEELKWKWVAEGFVDEQWGHFGQVAENYLNELVNRNLIQPIDYDDSQGYFFCRVHDMVLDLIVSLSAEENFATVLNGRVCNFLPSKIRRISMQSNDEERTGAIHAITETKLHVRSLNVYGAIEQIPPLVDFHALRVLDLRRCEWLEDKHVQNIGSLCQLRYLHLDSGRITKLPGEIGKLQYLETLDLRGCYSIQRLPSTLVELPKVLRLFLGSTIILPADKFGSMQTLEELIFWRTDNPVRFAEELGHLRKLRKLTMDGGRFLTIGDDGERVLQLLSSALSELGKCNLRYLSANGDICMRLFRDPSCTTYVHLRHLEITTETGRVPNGMASLRNVVKLHMRVDAFDEEGLHLLMRMPSLEYLRLELYLLKEKLVIGPNGFKHLKVFDFSHRFQNITSSVGPLEFTPGATPALRRLHIRLSAYGVMSGYYGAVDFGIEHLSALVHFLVEIHCAGATLGKVEAVEALVEKAIGRHPICQTLNAHVRRLHDQFMISNERAEEARGRVYHDQFVPVQL